MSDVETLETPMSTREICYKYLLSWRDVYELIPPTV